MSILSESLLFDLLVIVTILIVIAIAYGKWKLSYWDNKLPTLPTSFPFGNTKDLILTRKTFGEQFCELYREFRSKGYKHGGIYVGLRPTYLVIDPDMMVLIMQKDFGHFINHGRYINEENDPLSGHLFNLEDQKWKNMRAKLTPTFTSSKIRMMFQTVADCAVGLGEIMHKSATTKEPVEMKDTLGRFTTDIIGSVAFGLECDSLKNPDAEFRKYGKRIFERDAVENVKFLMQFLFPRKLLDLIKFKITNDEVEKFFMKVIHNTVNYREQNNIFRKDFMHLLLQLKNRGVISDDANIERTGEFHLNMNELAAQAFVFFFAGFETTSTAMTFALFELAQNPEIQDKLREEIVTVLQKNDNEMTYDSIMQMTYMDKVLHETLRKHPPVPILNRRCNKDYPIPDTNVVIKKGTDVTFSVLGVHSDPEYYPDPEKFDPERFTEENKSRRPDFTWIPFGEGPRRCIGLRFGMLQSKVGLITILKDYKLKVSNKTQLPIKLDRKTHVTTAEGGIWLEVEKLS